MARSAINYLRLLQSLLPRGAAWNQDEDSGLTQFLYGLSDELARIDLRSSVLLNERDTRYASELLADHENDLGLPDECSPEGQTITERREAAHSKLIALGQQSPTYFIELAAAFGWTITITEYTPFWSGIGIAGEECGDQNNIFHWKVTVSYEGGNIVYFTSGSSQSGDPLAYIPGSETVICMLERYKPAHTTLLWDYDGPEFDVAFSAAFDAMPSGETSYLEGAFWHEFSNAYDVNWGGDFGHDDFNDDFRKPY